MGHPQMTRYLSRDQIKTNTRIAITEKTITQASTLHWHNFFEIELILDGSGYQLLNGKRMALSRGCVSLLRLTDFHQLVPQNRLKLLNIGLDDGLLPAETMNRLASAERALFFTLEEPALHTMETLLRLCMEENASPAPDPRYLGDLLNCVFNRLFRIESAEAAPTATPKSTPIQAALLYLHMHFRENPRLSELAEIAHYNTSYFSIVFHRELGMTYCQYLNMLKISYAKSLLLSSGLKISDICFECGFTSRANFLRLFKKQVGLSPLQFRKMALAAGKTVDKSPEPIL